MTNKRKGPSKLLAVFVVFAAIGFIGMSMKGSVPSTDNPIVSSTPKPSATSRAFATARAVDVTDSVLTEYVRSQGYRIQAYEDVGPVRCDFTLDNTSKATVTWTDGGKVYVVSGDVNAMSRLYVSLLGMEDWDSCQYAVRKHARVGYGSATKAREAVDSLSAYTARMKDTLDWKPTPTPPPPKIHYVLNKDSRVFHYPDCWAGEHIAKKKRKDVTTTREKVVANGYSPCGICNP